MSNTSIFLKESAVVDNNILVDLYELGRLDVLFSTFDVISIPKLIYDEELPEAIKEEIIKYEYILSNIESEEGYSIYYKLTENYCFRNLSTQDKLAISIAKQNDYYCNSNDGLVRKACDYFDVRYLGILGLLRKAYEKGIIAMEEIIDLVKKLSGENTSCYIKKSIVTEFLKSLSK